MHTHLCAQPWWCAAIVTFVIAVKSKRTEWVGHSVCCGVCSVWVMIVCVAGLGRTVTRSTSVTISFARSARPPTNALPVDHSQGGPSRQQLSPEVVVQEWDVVRT
jgi:hypothetical protein